jgi:hypothetical protein
MIGVRTIARGMEALKPAKFKAIAGEILPELIRHWHATMLPRHFEPGAVQRYGYKARSAKYLARKRREGNSNPLVGLKRNSDGHARGQAMEMLRMAIRIVNKKDGKRGVMKAPKYFYQHHINVTPDYQIKMRDGTMKTVSGLKGGPDKPNEATRTTEDEVKVLAHLYDEMLEEKVNADKSETSRMVA